MNALVSLRKRRLVESLLESERIDDVDRRRVEGLKAASVAQRSDSSLNLPTSPCVACCSQLRSSIHQSLTQKSKRRRTFNF